VNETLVELVILAGVLLSRMCLPLRRADYLLGFRTLDQWSSADSCFWRRGLDLARRKRHKNAQGGPLLHVRDFRAIKAFLLGSLEEIKLRGLSLLPFASNVLLKQGTALGVAMRLKTASAAADDCSIQLYSLVLFSKWSSGHTPNLHTVADRHAPDTTKLTSEHEQHSLMRNFISPITTADRVCHSKCVCRFPAYLHAASLLSCPAILLLGGTMKDHINNHLMINKSL
jgi:hypothetical protein